MWYLVKIVLFSLAVIILGQYLWEHVKGKYSSNVTKNIVEFQTQKYREILNDMAKEDSRDSASSASSSVPYANEIEKQLMMDELSKLIQM